MAAKLTLYGFPFSPFSQRVEVALTEKGIPFELVNVDFSNKPKEFLEANPIYGKVPTIVHEGKSVAESLVILEYLEDVWPKQVPLLPEAAFEKSEVRFWASYMYDLLSKVQPSLYAKPGSPERKTALEAVDKGFPLIEEAMTKFSAEGPFFTGDKFGYLDVVMVPLTNFVPLLQQAAGVSIPGPDAMPRFHKWMAATKAHPSVSKTLPSEEETVSFFTPRIKSRQAAAAAAAK